MHTSNPELGRHRSDSITRLPIFEPTGELPGAPLQAGYGRCSAPGCNCPSYMGQGQLCENCGHNYSMHW